MELRRNAISFVFVSQMKRFQSARDTRRFMQSIRLTLILNTNAYCFPYSTQHIYPKYMPALHTGHEILGS